MTFLNFVAGQFTSCSDGQLLTHIDPTTGEARAQLQDSDVLDVVSAIQAGHKAFPAWSKTSTAERAKTLLAIADQLDSRGEAFALAQANDLGIPVSSTRKHSLPRAAEEFRYHARAISDGETNAVLSDKHLHFESRLPSGVVAILTPASDPLVAIASRVAPAIAAGNVAIIKPSRYTPETADIFAQALAAAQLPAGVVAVLHGRGEQVGATLVEHPGISTIAFVGSTEKGKVIAAKATELLKKTHLALSSRNPVIVFGGVDLPKVMAQVAEACSGSHPSLSARGSRIFIQDSIYKEALELLQKELSAKKIGDPKDESTQVGPLVNQKYFAKYRETVAFSSKQNGKLLLDGLGQPSGFDRGFFVNPVLISDLTNCSTLQQEEIVGPFLNVNSFKYQNDALKHANTSPFGQLSYLYDANGARSKRVATQIECGQVLVNSSFPLWNASVELEALKQSGSGRVGGLALLNFFSRRVLIAENFGA